jgi:hypothetical protein
MVANTCCLAANVSMVKFHMSVAALYVLNMRLKLGMRIPVSMFSRRKYEKKHCM